MRSYPVDQYDQERLVKLNAEDWMVELLKVNPKYVYWGPHEDYMWADGKGWASRVLVNGWKENSFNLDDLNECVNFYFEVERKVKKCEACDQSGYNPATKKISDDYYDFSKNGTRWCSNITQDEVDALWEHERLQHAFKEGKPTAEQVNKWNEKGIGHDAINKGILIEARAKRLGVWGYCEECNGDGEIYIEEKAHVNLILWILHPRKGCSRGVEISYIQKEELPEIKAYLEEARKRNDERFSRLNLIK